MGIINPNQKLLPSLKQMQDVEHFLASPFQTGILLDVHIARLESVMRMVKAKGKQLILHVDLIQGLQSDEAGVEFVCQEFRPLGIISTRTKAILAAKHKKVLAVQRVFLIDSNALEHSYRLMEQTDPDYIEVLPGILPGLIREVKDRTRKPILAGGFLRTKEDVEQALAAGAVAVTTSNRALWKQYAAAEGV
mgnify:CR=1 FL=1